MNRTVRSAAAESGLRRRSIAANINVTGAAVGIIIATIITVHMTKATIASATLHGARYGMAAISPMLPDPIAPGPITNDIQTV